MNNWVGGGGIQKLGRIQGILHYVGLSSNVGDIQTLSTKCQYMEPTLHTHMRAEHGIQESLDTKFQGRN